MHVRDCVFFQLRGTLVSLDILLHIIWKTCFFVILIVSGGPWQSFLDFLVWVEVIYLAIYFFLLIQIRSFWYVKNATFCRNAVIKNLLKKDHTFLDIGMRFVYDQKEVPTKTPVEHPHLNFVQVPRAFTSVCQVFYVLLPVAVKFWGECTSLKFKRGHLNLFLSQKSRKLFSPHQSYCIRTDHWLRKILILESLFLSLKYVFPSFLKHVCSVEDRNGPPGRTPA